MTIRGELLQGGSSRTFCAWAGGQGAGKVAARSGIGDTLVQLWWKTTLVRPVGPQERRQSAMTNCQGRRVWHLWLLAGATMLSVAACGSSSAGGSSGQSASAVPALSPSARTTGLASPPAGNVAAGRSACGLISAGDAAAALGMAVGKGRPSPGVDLSNKAVGGGCQWSDSAGGTAVVVIVWYPSSSIASKVFRSSAAATVAGAVPGAKPVDLPDLGLSEAGDTGIYVSIQGWVVTCGFREL